MLRNLINTYLLDNIKDVNSVSLMFSGGLDSLSILLSCINLGIKPHLYTFRLSNHVSDDYIYSKRISELYDLEFTEIILNTEDIDLISDVSRIVDMFKVRKKTQIQCIHPFLYVIPQIKEKYVLTGLCADDLYGTARSIAKYSKNTEKFNDLRIKRHLDDQSSSYRYIKKLSEDNDKVFIAPYKESIEIFTYMIKMNYKELNSPKQKYIMYCDYKEDLVNNNLYRRNSNLQCDSKIREWHDELLSSDLNTEGFKSVTGIYNKIYKRHIL